jgi:single-strand DNA-binding protein
MNSNNRVQLIGNLGMDPEIKLLDNDKKVAKFSLATSDSYKTESGDKVTETTWHNIVLWNNLAQIAEKLLMKGDKIFFEGKIVYRSYEDKKGNTKHVTEIVGTEFFKISK